jgi:hypothetical protein
MSTSGGTRSSSNARGGRGGAGTKGAKETAHETAARLQREQGLRPESQPGQPLVVQGNQQGHRFEPTAPINPSELARLYGEHQLGAALSAYSKEALLRAAEANHIAVGRGSHASIVSKMTAAVTGGRYSANFPKASTTKNTPEARHAARISKIDAQIARLQAQREQLVRQGPGAGATRANSPTKTSGAPRAMRATWGSADVTLPLNPQVFAYSYGLQNLGRALGESQIGRLRETAQRVARENGVTPPAFKSKQQAIDFIVSHTSYTRADEERFHQQAIKNNPSRGDQMNDGSPWRPDGHYTG